MTRRSLPGIAAALCAAASISLLPSSAHAAGYLTPKDARSSADTIITPAQLKDYLSFIASDELQGRDTPSNGLNTAALFLATQLSHWGFRPGGDNGTFFQKIALQRLRQDSARSSASLSRSPLRFGDDFVLSNDRRRGGEGDIKDAPLVFVSHGWVIPNRNMDAYKGVDVKGKLLVVDGRRMPEGVRMGELMGPNAGAAMSAQQYGVAHGAVGIVYIAESDDDYAGLKGNAQSGGSVRPVDNLGGTQGQPVAAAPTLLPSVVISSDTARRLFDGEKLGPEQALAASTAGSESPAFDLSQSKHMSLSVHYATDIVPTQNVVAIWEGSDDKLKQEYVALGAHYDHLGMSLTPDQNGDTIYNGADDDGSGTTGLLAMAEAFSHSKDRPKRSILFVWHCGEEKGLWGSAYFTSHPTVPLKDIAAQLNIDMIGRSKKADDTIPADANLSGPHEIYVIGSKMLSTELGKLSESVNDGYQKLALNYRYDDPSDPNRFFYRSDHFNYAKHGIPIIFYFDGVHVDYHRRSDEVSKIDFDKMAAVTRTVFLTATNIADMPHMPIVDKTPAGVEKTR